MADKQTLIGVIAPSSKIPRVELKLGLTHIEQAGFKVKVHPQVHQSHLFFAGKDEARAKGLWDFANDGKMSAIWCARGGYGAIRLLPYLEKWSKKRKPPSQKLLIGYSDVTALMEFVRNRWGWSTLHAPMPSLRKFSLLPADEYSALCAWINHKNAQAPWLSKKLQFWSGSPKKKISAPLVGGNLTVWNSLLGTPYEGIAKGNFLFLEDIEEPLYRIDRLMQQLILSHALNGIKGIVLGNFMNCKDVAPAVLSKAPPRSGKHKERMLLNADSSELRPLRKTMKPLTGLKAIFNDVSRQLKIPVVYGLPVGHGPEVAPLPLGARYELSPNGIFSLQSWDWLEN